LHTEPKIIVVIQERVKAYTRNHLFLKFYVIFLELKVNFDDIMTHGYRPIAFDRNSRVSK